MAKNILAITCSIAQSANQAKHLIAQSSDVSFDGGVLADLQEFMVYILFGLGDKLLDSGRVDPSILDQPFHRKPGDFTPDGAETADPEADGESALHSCAATYLCRSALELSNRRDHVTVAALHPCTRLP